MSRMLNLSWMAWSRARVATVADPAAARRHLERIVAMATLPDTELAAAHRSLAGLHLRAARYADARRHLLAAFRWEPNAETILQLARAWEDDPYGDDLRAAKAYRRATRLAPTNALAWAALGRAAVRCGRERLAMRAIRRAVALAPADAAVLSLAVDALRESGRLAAALRILSRAQFRAPRSATIRDLVNRVRFEIARTRRPAARAEGSTASQILPFVRVVGSDGERRVVRRDELARPAPVSIRFHR